MALRTGCLLESPGRLWRRPVSSGTFRRGVTCGQQSCLKANSPANSHMCLMWRTTLLDDGKIRMNDKWCRHSCSQSWRSTESYCSIQLDCTGVKFSDHTLCFTESYAKTDTQTLSTLADSPTCRQTQVYLEIAQSSLGTRGFTVAHTDTTYRWSDTAWIF